jgi:hypothetical protein
VSDDKVYSAPCLYGGCGACVDDGSGCECPCHERVAPVVEERPYVEVIHLRASEPDKNVSDRVRWDGPLPREGETMIVWGDHDAFQYRVKGVTHHIETKGGDRLVKTCVWVGLYEERAPRGPVDGGAGEW